MSNTTFSGPVRSAGGFETISVSPTTGAVTVTSTIGAATSVTSLSATTVGTVDLTATGVVIMSGLPTSDPVVAGQLWNNAGVLSVSAGV